MALDRDGDGTVTPLEFSLGLRSLGCTVSAEEFRLFFSALTRQ